MARSDRDPLTLAKFSIIVTSITLTLTKRTDMKKTMLLLAIISISSIIGNNPAIQTDQDTLQAEIELCSLIKKNYEKNYAAWNTLSAQEKQNLVEDEFIFRKLEELLKNTQINETEKREFFIRYFNQMHNKEHRKQAGTILAIIVSFTHGKLQEELVAIAFAAGVSTDLLPGEFYNGKYRPQGKTFVHIAQKHAEDNFAQAKIAAKDSLAKIKNFIDENI